MFSIAIYSIVWGKDKNFIRTEYFSTIHDKKDGCYFGYTFAFIKLYNIKSQGKMNAIGK